MVSVLCSFSGQCEDRDPKTRECKASYTCNQQAKPHVLNDGGLVFLRRSDIVLLEAFNILKQEQPTKPQTTNNGVR